MNASQLVSYDFFKESLLSHGLENGMPLHILSSALSGTVATTICAPADVVKSRVMNASGNDGPVKLLMESLKKEGPRFLFKGWLPAWSESPLSLSYGQGADDSPIDTEYDLYVCVLGAVEEGSRHVPVAQGARGYYQGVGILDKCLGTGKGESERVQSIGNDRYRGIDGTCIDLMIQLIFTRSVYGKFDNNHYNNIHERRLRHAAHASPLKLWDCRLKDPKS
jgi:hypothetical protein